MISIIIPVYNVEKYLPQCLDSVLSQTYTNYEVILVDDGSPDGSGAICDAYAQKDSRFRVIHQKNAGVSAARNNGIEQAAGEWVTFIDSDDWVEPNYLSNFRLDESDGIDLIIQGLEYYDHRDGHFFNPWSFKDCVLKKQDFRLGFAENRLMEVGFPVGKAYCKKLLIDNDLRFDSRISFHEDHIFVLDYYKVCHSIRLVNATDYKYRCYHTGASLSSKRHPWKKMNLAGDEMLRRIADMKDVFYENGSPAAKRILTFAYQCKMTAINELFRESDGYARTKANYQTVINKEDLRNMYYPEDRKGKLYKNIILHIPFCGVYLFFKTLVLYQNRNL